MKWADLGALFTPSEKTKLAGVEDGATADQTNDEIRDAVEAATNSNAFTDGDHSKLGWIENSATADQTGAEIKTAYEGEADTNAYDDAAVTKLAGIDAGADVTGSNPPQAHGASVHTDRSRTIYLSSPFYGNGAATAEGYALDPASDEEVYFGLVLPSDWETLVSLEVVWNIGLSDSADAWVMNVGTYYGADGEVYFTHSDGDGANILATPAANFKTTVTGTTGLLASATKNDYVRIKVERDANHASDLYDYDIKIMGVKIVYTADM